MNFFKRGWTSYVIVTLIISLLAMTFQIQPVQAESPFDIAAESAILIEAKTGKILFKKNEDIPLPPASMSKMMTEYLVLEAIAKGDFGWDTVVRASSYAHYLGALDGTSRVWLADGEERTVEELYTAMAVYSANDATVALAELVAGSEGSFVEIMNQKAAELGMTNTRFVNSSGLPNRMLRKYMSTGTAEDENVMSAKDTALLAQALVNEYPEVLKFSSIPEKPAEYFNGVRMINWNWMLVGHPEGQARNHAYPGLDGLKTGYTDQAQNCFTGTAEREGMRLISVVMGSKSRDTRFQETRKLLDYGFNNYVYKEFAKAGDLLPETPALPVRKGVKKEIKVALGGPLHTVVHKDEEELYTIDYTLNQELLDPSGELLAPISNEAVVGEVVLKYTGEKQYDYIQSGTKPDATSLVALEDVESASWFRLFMRSILGFFSGIWTGITDSIKGLFS
ncbi:D-alanyl-D-alanine carboxypeptidase family protein [Caldalkalibacillus mannanilyticus]|uniref:D-alanyl-D-alanine carboxypeptidase family protein n=1 Tax=Caldalkalibacillus mannanilyticus TaxID=1418 RepID=UPI000468E884|nr:D-alanyl-D-alanine carboxypeptidase family protein [Caldalkalibacillus mannanilyticus]